MTARLCLIALCLPFSGIRFIAFLSASLSLCSSALRFSLDCLARRLFPYSPPDNAHYAAAAPSSLIVAACTPQRWLLPCLPPLGEAQKSQSGGASRAFRRSLRRQVGENSPMSPIVPLRFHS